MDQAVAIDQHLHGNGAEQSPESRSKAAAPCPDHGNADEAEKLYERVLAVQHRAIGADDAATLASMNSLGDRYLMEQRWEEAHRLFDELVARSIRKLGPSNPDTIMAMVKLGGALAALGKRAQAIAIHAEALSRGRQAFGSDNPAILPCMNAMLVDFMQEVALAPAQKLSMEALARADTRTALIILQPSSCAGSPEFASHAGRYGPNSRLPE